VLLPMELWKGVHNMPGTRVEQLDPANGFNAIALNFQNPEVDFFQDVRVREAMQDAGDQKTLVKDVLHGFGAQVYTAIPTGDNEFLDPQLARQYPVGYDPAKARALLEQAGYRPGPDGIMQKGGRRLEFTVLLATGSEEFTEMTEFMQANLRAVGIQMDLKFMDFNTILGLVNGAPSGWQATVYEFFSGNYPSGDTGDTTYLSGNNHENYSDPEMDRHIHDSMYKPGFGGLYDYERYASAQQPSIFSVEQAPVYLVNDRLHGVNDFIDPAGQLAVDALNCTNNAAK
jgi:peptide/nickel transport system substrate-binding protein